jgi:hypothetical protein
MRLLMLVLVAVIPCASPGAQEVEREWELGPTYRYYGGALAGLEIRRATRVHRRIDTRFGGYALASVRDPLAAGIPGAGDVSIDGRHQRFVASAGADARFALLTGRMGAVYVLGGADLLAIQWGRGAYHRRVDGVESASDFNGRISVQPAVNVGVAFEFVRHISLEARVEAANPDPTPLGAIRISLRRRW